MTKKDLLEINEEKVFDSLNVINLTEDVKHAINIISYKPEEIHVYGSYNFRAQPSPSDIDLYEKIKLCEDCTYKEAIKNGAEIMQKLIRKIIKIPNVYIGDVKFCADTDIKDLIGNENIINTESINKIINKMYKNKYIKKDEYKKMLDLNKESNKFNIKREKEERKNKTYEEGDDYDDEDKYIQELFEIFRNLTSLRWTKEEILKGEKKLVGNRKITLEKALSQCKQEYYYTEDDKNIDYNMAKIDLWMKINNRFVEVTNLLMFFYTKKEKEEYITFSRERGTEKIVQEEMITGLREEIAKYYYSKLKKFYKPLKYAKRIFSLSQILEDKKTGLKLVKLWRSPLNTVGSIQAELGTLKDIIMKVKNPPLEDIFHQIDEIKLRLDRIIDIEIPQDIYNEINKLSQKKIRNPEKIAESIEKIETMMKEIVDPLIVEYLKSVKLWPAPKKYLDVEYFGMEY